MSKIALSMIIKDDSEAQLLERCLPTIMPYVDKLFVTGTNTPDDKIKAIVDKYEGSYSFFKWVKSFEKARNYALSQIPDSYDYIMWCDADDMWEGAENISKAIAEMEKRKLTGIYFDYNYEIGVDGDVRIKHPRERIVKNGYYEWKGHLHETLVPKREVENGYFKDIVVNHYPPESAKEGALVRNLEILEQMYKDEGDNHDPRTEFYLARNLFDVDQADRAYELFTDYLKHSGWDEERAEAHHYMALTLIAKGKMAEAIDHLLISVKEAPLIPTWYITLAYTYTFRQEWDKATHFARLFVNTPQPNTSIVQTPINDEMRYYETIFNIAMGKQKIDEAVETARELVNRIPNRKDYHERLAVVTRIKQLTDVTKGLARVIEELDESGEAEKIQAMLNVLPKSIEDNAYASELRQKYGQPTIWPSKSIVYYTGMSFEEWSPKSLKTGLGGSETAVVQLAKTWRSLGYTVTVYGNHGGNEGVYEGVQYLNHYKFNPRDTFDVLISWRTPQLADYGIKCRKLFIDLHDVPNQNEFTKDRLKAIDAIFVKSQYHRNLLPDIPDDKFVIVTNGVDPKLEPKKIEKIGNKIIWASSYDRGLHYVLHQWNKIKTAIPDATLDVYYGWNLFDVAWKNNPERMAWKTQIDELMKQDGITHHGRVGHKELLKAKASARIHYYPTDFEEIDCISVRESALVQCVPVTSDYAALKEKAYGVRVSGDPRSEKTQDAMADKVIELLSNHDTLTTLATDGQIEAKKETWMSVGKKWLNQT